MLSFCGNYVSFSLSTVNIFVTDVFIYELAGICTLPECVLRIADTGADDYVCYRNLLYACGLLKRCIHELSCEFDRYD